MYYYTIKIGDFFFIDLIISAKNGIVLAFICLNLQIPNNQVSYNTDNYRDLSSDAIKDNKKKEDI